MAFLVGYDKKASWLILGGAGPVALNITEHSWSAMVDKLDVTHTGTGGVQAVLAGILRGDGNVKANSDDAVIISNIANVGIVPGASGTLYLYHYAAASNPFVIPGTILRVNYKSVVNGVANYDFDVCLNRLLGVYTPPQ